MSNTNANIDLVRNAYAAFGRQDMPGLLGMMTDDVTIGIVGRKEDAPFLGMQHGHAGVGVATALLLDAGIAVVSQRDFRTLARLRRRLDPTLAPPADARDHHEHAWTVEHLPGPHPRAR